MAKDESSVSFNQNEIDLAETIAVDISAAIENEFLNEQARLLLHQLRPSVIDEEGLVKAIQQRLDAVERRANIDAQMVIRGNLEALPQNIEDEFFNIAQEALNNSLRHAMAAPARGTQVRISVRMREGAEGL